MMFTGRKVQPLHIGFKALLMAAAVLEVIGGIQLFVLSEHTDQYFAWTIASPLTAAFLGAAFFASVPFSYMSSQETSWARARIVVPATMVISVILLAATFLHLDTFHLNTAFGLGWLIVYILVPAAIVVLWILQDGLRGGRPERGRPLPEWLQIIFAAQGGIMIGLAVGLFALPGTFGVLWAWALTPLTARAIAAWLAGLGVTAIFLLRENDLDLVPAASISYAAFGLLQLAALARYGAEADLGSAAGIGFIIFIVSMILVGAYSVFLAWRGGK